MRQSPDGLSTTKGRTSCAHPARKRGYVERAEAIMLQPADIAVEEGPKVVHPIFEHREAIDTAAECEALPFFGIEARGSEHPRMDHAGTQHFHPPFLSPDDAPAFLHRPADVDLRRRLGERKVAGAHAKHDIVPLEE